MLHLKVLQHTNGVIAAGKTVPRQQEPQTSAIFFGRVVGERPRYEIASHKR